LNPTERIHTFGVGGSLVGIVSLPPGDDGSTAVSNGAMGRPFVILLNAGLVHRAGPFGMSVELARRLATQGFRVLRFDQAGLGDSLPRAGAADPQPAVADGRAAIDFLSQRYGAQRFVVGGLCSGAMNAHHLCLADVRVSGVWLLDGYAYATPLYYRQLVLRKLRKPETWVASAQRLVARATRRLGAGGTGALTSEPVEVSGSREALFFQDWPPVEDARLQLQEMLGRGARMLFVYTGGWSYFVAEEQFDEMFPRLEGRQQITVKYHPEADHSYLLRADREAMFGQVEAFLKSFPLERR
jgi:pimeloyl-ACP methyl ester carboxylesterase